MRKTCTIIILLILPVMIIGSCNKTSTAPPSPCDGVDKNFSIHVNPIIQTFCNQAACHNPGSTNGPGQLTIYAEIFNNRAAIKAQVEAGLMPQNTTLTAAQKNSIICWIESGAPNN